MFNSDITLRRFYKKFITSLFGGQRMLKSGIRPDQYHFLTQITQKVVLMSTQEVNNVK